MLGTSNSTSQNSTVSKHSSDIQNFSKLLKKLETENVNIDELKILKTEHTYLEKLRNQRQKVLHFLLDRFKTSSLSTHKVNNNFNWSKSKTELNPFFCVNTNKPFKFSRMNWKEKGKKEFILRTQL